MRIDSSLSRAENVGGCESSVFRTKGRACRLLLLSRLQLLFAHSEDGVHG